MKKIIVLSIVAFFVIMSSFNVFADNMKPPSVDSVLNDIKQEQGVQSTDKIDPNAVSQEKLEELGDSVMEAMIGNSEMHDQMDNQLGGDGSASLTAFHIRLGYNYLVGYPNGMMSLMTNGMMGSGTYQTTNGTNWSGNMMGYNSNRAGMMNYFGFGGLMMGIFGLFFLLIIFILYKLFNKKSHHSASESALDVLGKRFANGEISEDDFKKMKDVLRK